MYIQKYAKKQNKMHPFPIILVAWSQARGNPPPEVSWYLGPRQLPGSNQESRLWTNQEPGMGTNQEPGLGTNQKPGLGANQETVQREDVSRQTLFLPRYTWDCIFILFKELRNR
jgi:hypothetical protein